MFKSLGTTELIIIVLILILLFGGKKVPEFIREVAGALKEFQKDGKNEDEPKAPKKK